MVAYPLVGGCQCGDVRFEVTEQLLSANSCHCSKCRKRTGTAASASAFVAPHSVRVVCGQELLSAWTPDARYEHVFCGTCGSPLWSARCNDHEIVVIRLGAIEGDPGIRPSLRQFVGSAAPFEPIPDDGLPHYTERRPAGS